VKVGGKMGFTSQYIIPNIYECDNIEEIQDDELYHYFIENISVNAIYESRYSFVLGKAGYGKSRLLRELFLNSIKDKKEAVLVDLKKFTPRTFNELIDSIQSLKAIDLVDESDIQTINNCCGYEFSLTTESEFTLYLDSLDEIAKRDIIVMYNIVQQFISDYPNAKIIIASRIEHFLKYEIYLKTKRFRLLKLVSFSGEQVVKYLEKNNVKPAALSKIMNLDLNLIRVPRYLKYLLDISNLDPGILDKMTDRKDVLENLIVERVNSSVSSIESRAIITVFSLLALSMEIKQTNQIDVDNLVDFFDNIDSEVCRRFFYKSSLDDLCNETILKQSDGYIHFEDSEIQEFLAARILSRQDNLKKVLFEFATDETGEEIYTSWFNTISYVLEYSPKLFIDIIKFLGTAKYKFNCDSYKLIERVSFNDYSNYEREMVADIIYAHYQELGHWIPYEVEKGISQICDERKILEFISGFEDIKRDSIIDFQRGNLLGFVNEYLTRSNENCNTDFVMKRIYELVLSFIDASDHSVVHRNAVDIIANYYSIEKLVEICSYIDLNDETVENTLIRNCSNVHPNEEYSIDLYMKFLGSPYLSSYKIIEAISKITTSAAFVYLLKSLLINTSSLSKVLSSTSDRWSADYKKIEIQSNVNGDLINCIEELITVVINDEDSLLYYAQCSKFFYHLIEIYDSECKNNTLNLIRKLEETKGSKNLYFHFLDLLIGISNDDNINGIIEWFSVGDSKEYYISTFLNNAYYKGHLNYEKYKHYSDIYLDSKDVLPTSNNKPENSIYYEFKKLLEPEARKYNINVFRYFIENIDGIDKGWTDEDCERLIMLALENIEGIDFNQLRIERSEGGSGFTFSSAIQWFGDSVLTLERLNFDLSKFRSKFIKFVALADRELTPVLIKWIGYLSPSEQSELAEEMIHAKDLRAFLYVSTTIEFLKKLNTVSDEIVDLLVFILNSEFVDEHSKIEIIEFIDQIKSDKLFLKKLYEKENDKIADAINRILVEKYDDAQAIKIRIKGITRYRKMFKKQPNSHSLSKLESEYRDLHFAFPLVKISCKYETEILSLLLDSFKAYKSNEQYYDYAQYIWKVVEIYYYRLIDIDPSLSLSRLHQTIIEMQNTKGVNIFLYSMKKIVNYQIKAKALTRNYSECVKFLNRNLKKETVVTTSDELKNIVIDVIEKDLRNWIENIGAYRMINDMKNKQEDLIQKTMVTQLQSYFYKRNIEVIIDREVNLLDNKRVDLIISYGFVGRVIVEIKRLDNPDLQSGKIESYLEKLEQYRNGFNSDHLVFLIIKINNRVKKLESKVEQVAEAIGKNNHSGLYVVGVDGILDNVNQLKRDCSYCPE